MYTYTSTTFSCLCAHGAASAAAVGSTVFINKYTPRACLQLLWVNMMNGVALGSAIATEPAESGVMTTPPRRPDKRLIGKFVLFRSVVVTLAIAVAVCGAFWWSVRIGQGVTRSQTVALNTFAASQVTH